jgi:uncharacterized protein YukE
MMEVLGEQVPLPDPDAIEDLAGHYGQVRDQIGSVQDQLQGADQDITWTGAAADAFRKGLGDLPGELVKAHNSYSDMAITLSAYASGVRSWVDQYQSLARQANDVDCELEQAKYALQQAKATGADTTSLQARVDSLNDELSSLQRQLSHLVDSELHALASTCVQGIRQAEHAGISNSYSFWGSICEIFDDIGEAMVDVGDFVYDAIIKPIASLPGDIVNVCEHPDDLSAWSSLLGDTGTLIGVVSLALPGVGELLLPMALSLDAVHLGVDTAQVVEGHGSALNLLFDGVAVVGDGTAVLGAGADASEDAVKGLTKQAGTYVDEGHDMFNAGRPMEEGEGAAAMYAKADKTYTEAFAQRDEQSVAGLFKEGFGSSITNMVKPSEWKDALTSFKPTHIYTDLADAFKTPDILSSPASVLSHRISAVAAPVATAAVWTGNDLQAHGIG